MASERIQRRIEQLLDEADEAVSSDHWAAVRQRAGAVLAFAPDDQDARSYLEAAERKLGEAAAEPTSSSVATPATAITASSHPSSFVAGRYRVERFLGEGGRQRSPAPSPGRLHPPAATRAIAIDQRLRWPPRRLEACDRSA